MPHDGAMSSVRASNAGIGSVAASGTKIRDYAERRFKEVDENWTPMGMSMQVSDVNKVLAAESGGGKWGG